MYSGLRNGFLGRVPRYARVGAFRTTLPLRCYTSFRTGLTPLLHAPHADNKVLIVCLIKYLDYFPKSNRKNF
ncbi:MAG: hypothetical protein NZ455_08555 [Bacteroidia bacterium]|nr:hypothetical protein [Bacteroidia bacterium]MDW8347975.1 hypothetical protein [Bacteroidia bacterium]